MKIINLIQKPQLRGAEIFACQLSNHLVKLGHDVRVVSIFTGDANLPFSGELTRLDRPISKRLFDVTGWKEFATIVNEFQPDVIQANAADTLKFAVSSKLLYKWNTKIVFRNANKMGDFINSKFKWYLNKFYVSKVDAVISVSKECEKNFVNTFNFPNNLVSTVEIGVEEQQIGAPPLDLIDVYAKGPVLVHIGGFVPEKNHKELIKIFKEAKSIDSSIQLLLLGKGALENDIRELVKLENLENDVHFLGYRNDVLEILANAQIFVLPSLIEGLPGVILEAMYCKTPVVAYNVGGISEVVQTDKTGWLIAENDQSNFLYAIEEILDPDANLLPRINGAKRLIQEKFLNLKIAERFVAQYKKALEKKT